MTEIYVSVDIEADGPIPGDYSMLSLGSAAYDSDGNLISTFTVNVAPLEGAKQQADTMGRLRSSLRQVAQVIHHQEINIIQLARRWFHRK